MIAGFNQSQRASEFESVRKVEHWAKSGRDSICLGGTISSTKNRTGGVAFYVCIHLRTSPTILYCTYRNRSQTHLESYVSPLFWSIQTSQTEPVCLGRFSLSLLLFSPVEKVALVHTFQGWIIVGSWVDKVSHWNLWSKLELALVSFKWCIYTNRTLSNSNCVCVFACLLAWVRACCWLYARWAAANMNVSFSLLSWLFVEADDRDLKISLGAAPCLSSYSSAFLCPQSTSTPLILSVLYRCFDSFEWRLLAVEKRHFLAFVSFFSP